MNEARDTLFVLFFLLEDLNFFLPSGTKGESFLLDVIPLSLLSSIWIVPYRLLQI